MSSLNKAVRNAIILGLLTVFSGCSRVYHIAKEDPQTIRINEKIAASPSDSEVESLIAPYKAQLDQQMSQVIGQSAMELLKEKPESTLGNWVADAILDYAIRHTGKDLDLAMSNYGGLRIPSLPAGEINKGKIYELMPFDNYLVVLSLKGDVLMRLFERIADYGGWPISRGVQLSIRDSLVHEVTLHGLPIYNQKIYTIVISDYVANGGDRCDFLEDQPRENLEVYFRDALIDQVMWLEKNGKQIEATIEGRTIVLEE